MSEPDRVDLRAGDVLAGKYRVERVLGAGGMGVVVAAHHLQLDERVALKFLHPDVERSVEATSRFVREARAAAKIKSEHVARVTDVGELENGSPYMVMEYLEGSDLSERLETDGPLPVAQAVDFVLQTCEALASAHTLGIIHRDLKPANLFCTERPDGQLAIKVLDFGISKVTTPDPSAPHMTRTHAVIGTAPYMSPEQMKQSRGVDARADIWSLGIVLFELLTGRLPFDSDVVTHLAIKVASEPPPPLNDLRPDAPAGLERVIATCLEKDRERRFQTVGELAIALKDYGSKRARGSVERVLGTLRKAGVSGAVLPPSGEFEADPSRAPTISLPGTPRLGAPPAPVTATSWGETGPGSRSRIAMAGLAVAVPLVVFAVVLARTPHGQRASAPPEGPSVTTHPSAAESPEPAPALVATVSNSGSPSPSVPTIAFSALPPAADPIAVTPVVAPPPGAPGARAAHSPSPSPSPRASSAHAPVAPSSGPRPNCNPPYVIDSAGHREYRPECLNY
jgi:serine/threonine-protein kinase